MAGGGGGGGGDESVRRALFWICVAQLVFAALIGGLSAAYFGCGMNIQCFASFVCALLFVVPSSVYAYIGMQCANYKQATKVSIIMYAIGCFVLAAVEAFIAVNMDLNQYGILQATYEGFAALQAATGITSLVLSQSVSTTSSSSPSPPPFSSSPSSSPFSSQYSLL